MHRRTLFKSSALIASASLVGCDTPKFEPIDLVADTDQAEFNHPPLYFSDTKYHTPLTQVSNDQIKGEWRRDLLNSTATTLNEPIEDVLDLAFTLMLAPSHDKAGEWAAHAMTKLANTSHLADLVLIEGLGVYCAHLDTPEHWQRLLKSLNDIGEASNTGWYNFNQATPAFEADKQTLATECMALIKLKWQWRAAMKLKLFDQAFEHQIDHLRKKDEIKYSYLNPDEIFWMLEPDGNHLSGFEAFNLWCALRSDLITVGELPTFIQQIPLTSIGIKSIDKAVNRRGIQLEVFYHAALSTSLLRALGRNTELRFEQLSLALALNNASLDWSDDLLVNKPYNDKGSTPWFSGNPTLNAAAIFGLLKGEHVTAWN